MSNEVGFKNKKSRFSANLGEIKSRCCFWILAFCGSIFPVVGFGCEILPENRYVTDEKVADWSSQATTISVASAIKANYKNNVGFEVTFKIYGGTNERVTGEVDVVIQADPFCNDIVPNDRLLFYVFFHEDKYLSHMSYVDAERKRYKFTFLPFKFW